MNPLARLGFPAPAASRQGAIFIVSAPSGVGKTTLIHEVLARDPRLRFSVSCTTRPPRPGERDGVDYRFLDRASFVDGIRGGRFLEWAEVHGNLYGTDGAQVAAYLGEGYDVLLDIDVQGARQVKGKIPGAAAVFILPPSLAVLRERLAGRGTESEADMTRRLRAADEEIQNAPWYDFLVVNDRLEEAVADLAAIFRAARSWRDRRLPEVAHLFGRPFADVQDS